MSATRRGWSRPLASAGERDDLLDLVLGSARPSDAELGLVDLEGWTPGTVHPTGGFDKVTLAWSSEDPGQQSAAISCSLGGRSHCEGAAANLRILGDGRAEARWFSLGTLQRADGPSYSTREPDGIWEPHHWTWRHQVPLDEWEEGPQGSGAPSQRVAALLTAGADPAFVVPLLALLPDIALLAAAVHATRPQVEALRDLAASGLEHDTLAAVAAGELPASWASAGL